MRGAVPARGVVTVTPDNKETTQPVVIDALATIDRPAHFETLTELTVLPLVLTIALGVVALVLVFRWVAG